MKPKVGEIYTHRKGGRYEIICIAKDQDRDNSVDLVIYRALYPILDLGEDFAIDPIFSRSLEEFTKILPDGKRRFEKV